MQPGKIKPEQLYNLNTFQAFNDKIRSFKDSAPGNLLARQLEVINPEVFTKKYPELAFMNSGIETSNIGGWGNVITSLRRRTQGGFKTSGNDASNKGIITLAREASSIDVVGRDATANWTETELRQYEMEAGNLVGDFMDGIQKIYLRELDEIGFIGISDITGSVGLLNNSTFTSTAAASAIESFATGIEQYNAIKDFINAQRNAVKNTPAYAANVVIFPTSVYNFIQTSVVNATGGPITVLEYLEKTFPDITFTYSFRCEDVGGNSVTVAFSSNREAMQMRVPVPLSIGAQIQTGSFEFKMDSMYRVGGLDILEALSGRILTGL